MRGNFNNDEKKLKCWKCWKLPPGRLLPTLTQTLTPTQGKLLFLLLWLLFLGGSKVFFGGGQFSCQPEKLNLMKNVFVSDKSIIFFNIVFLTLHFIDN